MVDGISSSTNFTAPVTTAATSNTSSANTDNTAAAEQQAANSAAEQDTVEISSDKDTGNSKKSTYGSKPDSKVLSKLMKESEATIANFKSLVEKLIVKQGKANEIGSFDLNSFNKNNPLKSYMQDIIAGGVDQDTINKAKASIGEDGEFGVQKTAERILDFAKALIGDNLGGNFEKIKNAVVKGFEAATAAWGDELPEISKQTKQLIMDTFDQWEKDGNTSATPYKKTEDTSVGL